MFFRHLKWNVVGWFRTVSLISYSIIAAGALMIAYNLYAHHYPIKLGLSFTGGTDVTVKYVQPTTSDAIKSALATINVTDATVNTIQKAGDAANERFTISTQTDFGDKTGTVWTALGTAGSVDRPQSEIESVGPSLSHEYLIKALEALVIAIGIQFLYIAFRFGWNYIFGKVVVIALVRDAAMMIGIYALAQKRADDAFLAAVLTVIGYSVMDTIVILDRIRENVKLMPGEPYDKIVNNSILQTMTRSFNTLATVVITLVALLAFGGASLQNFAFALLVGICSGGYHSIFFSAPLVAVLQKRAKRTSIFRRSSLAGAPRTVAAARGGAAGAAAAQRDREAVAAARRARRDLERQGASRKTPPAPRYKRSQKEIDFEQLENRNFGAELPRKTTAAPESELHASNDQIDPLDAQAMGLHDEAAELGHEEITLNLGDDPHVPEPEAEHKTIP